MAEPTQKPALTGAFITFEGIDGCGKSTQAKLLAERLRDRGVTVLETREPGGTPIGASLRPVLLSPDSGEMHPLCELLLYLADRVQHLEQVIRPALARGETVLCDRFHDATVAYQHHGRGLDLAPLGEFLQAHVLNTPPALTFWLDLEVDQARSRMQGRRSGAAAAEPDESRLDQASRDFHERVRGGYAAIHAADPARVLRVPAGGSREQTHETIWNLIAERYHGL